MLFNLDGKKVLITGASGGIGYSIAEIFARQNAQVCISGSNSEKLETVKQQLSLNHLVVANLANKDESASLVESAHQQLGGLDIVICNAGVTKDSLAVRMNDNDFQSVVDINLTSTFIINKIAAKLMMKQRYGRIINITSVVGHSGNAGQANYCASKGGVTAMGKALALELAARNITVNSIAPGFIETKMTAQMSDSKKEEFKNKIPVGYYGKPEDVAHCCVYLASDEARYITGQTIHVNGGLLTS